MSKKFLLMITFLMIVSVILAACGNSDMAPADAEKGLEASLKGDWEEAGKYLCDQEIDSAKSNFDEDTLALLGDVEFDAVCKKDGNDMSCTMSMDGTEAFSGKFKIKDGKLCGEAK